MLGELRTRQSDSWGDQIQEVGGLFTSISIKLHIQFHLIPKDLHLVGIYAH